MFEIIKYRKGDHFALPKLFFKILGLKREKASVFYKCWITFSWIWLLSYTTIEIIELILCYESITKNCKLLMHLCASTLAYVKFFYFVKKKVLLFEIFDQLDNMTISHEHTKEEEEENKLIQTCVEKYNKYCFTVVYLILLYALFFPLSLIIQKFYKDRKDYTLDFEAITFTNITPFPIYELFWIFQYVYVLYMVCGYFGMPIYCVQILLNLNSRIDILRLHLSKSIENNNFLTKDNRQLISKIVIYHQEIYSVAEKVSKILEYILMIDFGNDVVIAALAAISALKMELGSGAFFVTIMDLVIVFIKLYFTCSLGQTITANSVLIADYCTELIFLNKDNKFQKTLLFVVQRSQKPITFSFGKFAILDLKTFVQVVKMMYSLLTLMLRTKDQN